MFTFDDFINGRVPEIGSREMITGEVASLKPMSHEEVSSMFPNIDLTNSEGIVYVPLTMCHSLPTINARKRCFTSNTLANSFASAVDSLIDREHMLEANGDLIPDGFSDQIIGHIKSARFTGSKLSSGKEVASEAQPLYALAALYMRASGVADMLQNHLTGKEVWRTSMECGHQWSDAHLMYRGDFIPIADAPGSMLENIKLDTILPYKGHEVAAVLGGVDGFVDFWGLALTTQPADVDTELIGMVAGQSRDLASRKIFHAPIRKFKCSSDKKALEVAGGPVDKKITELANITVIGETDEADGHKHLILSDLTILPAAGHDHWLDAKNITRGTKPVLTGRTGVHYTGVRNAIGERVDETPHLHLISLPLTGRFSSPQVSSGNSDGDSTSTEVSTIGDLDEMKLQDLLKKMEGFESQLASLAKGGGNDDESKFKEFASSFSGMMGELKEVASGEAINAAVEEEINKRIEAGTLLTKEKADEAVTTAVTEKQEEFDASKAEAEKRQGRLDQIKDAGINLDFELQGVNDSEGNPMTVQKVLDGLDTDDAGDNQFNLNFSAWKQIADQAKAQAEAESSQPAQEDVTTEQTAAAAASKQETKKNNGILATVGGNTSSEAASVPEDAKNAPRHAQGKHAVSSY